MKSILEYINESSSEKYFKFIFKDLDSSMIESLETIGSKKNVYVERIDGGVKIKATQSNKENLNSLVEPIVDFVNAHQNEEDEAKKEALDKIQATAIKMQEFIDEEPDDKSKEEPNEDDKKKDDEE